MRLFVINILSIILGAQVFFACAPSLNKEESPKHRLIHNNDGTDLLGNLWFNKRPLTLADLDSCVSMVANSQVTTYMICTGSNLFHYRSNYGRILGEDFKGLKLRESDSIQYKILQTYYLNHLNLEKEGTDLISYTLKKAKEKGLETFITCRLNDLHFNDTTTNCPTSYSEFWVQHPEYWLKDSTQGWNSAGALNFAIKEVRDYKLTVISEQLEKYANFIDGYDLDFMRFIVYFKSGTGVKNAPLLTQFVKDVRKKVDEISAKQGRKILLSARIAPTVEQNLMKGIDIREWLRLGLLDFISTGIHWQGNPAMPVAQFKEELGNDLNIPFYSSVDDGGYHYSQRETWSHGMYRGMCSHILSQGADGIYLFNYYFGELAKHNGKLHLEDGGQVCRVIMPELLQELGSLETLKRRNKIYALSDGRIEYEIKHNTPLPLNVNKLERSQAQIYVGDMVEEDYPQEVILFIRTNHPASYQLLVNGEKVEKEIPSYTLLYDKERKLKGDEKVYAFILPEHTLKHGNNTIEFLSQGEEFTIKRIELALKYGDVETHGYF